MSVMSMRKTTGVNLPSFELYCIVVAVFDSFLTKTVKFYQKQSKIATIKQYSSKPDGLTPVDFLLEITGIKTDKKQFFLFK